MDSEMTRAGTLEESVAREFSGGWSLAGFDRRRRTISAEPEKADFFLRKEQQQPIVPFQNHVQYKYNQADYL